MNRIKSILTLKKPTKCWCDRVWSICFKPSCVISRTSRSIDLIDGIEDSDVIDVSFKGDHSCQNWPAQNLRVGRPPNLQWHYNLDLESLIKECIYKCQGKFYNCQAKIKYYPSATTLANKRKTAIWGKVFSSFRGRRLCLVVQSRRRR